MILYLDTETTGLHPGQICQLSYVMQYADKTECKNFFFTVDYVEPSAVAVHGLSVEKLKVLSQNKRFSDFAKEISLDLESADVVVCHNFSFDSMFLRKEFGQINLPLLIKNEFCSMKKSTPICKLIGRRVGYKYPKLCELTAFLGIGDSEILAETRKLFGASVGFHDARFDTVAVYLAMKKGMNIEIELSGLRDYL